MSNTPPKFYISETSPDSDPTAGVATAWEVFDEAYRANRHGIVAVTHKVVAQSFDVWASRSKEPFNEPLVLEKALSEAHPEFMVATQGLKKSFDTVQGMGITWNHWQRGEPVGTEESLLDEHTILHTVVRADPTYPELSGFIAGHLIGPDPFLGGFNAWIDITEEPGRTSGIHHPLFEMYGIRITPEPPAK